MADGAGVQEKKETKGDVGNERNWVQTSYGGGYKATRADKGDGKYQATQREEEVKDRELERERG